jgi:3-dehydroquinate synthetase
MDWAHEGGYPVTFCTGAFGDEHRPVSTDLVALLRDRRVLVVTTPTVWRLFGSTRLPAVARAVGAALDTLVLPLDEGSKTPETVLEVCRRAEEHGIGRADLLIAFGGGLVCDVVTMAASQLHRGVPYACLPTTLVGQIDAGIGLKGGVNLDGAKNRVGTFYAPEGVVCDPGWLGTLDDRAMRSGLAEIVKVGVTRDADLFRCIEAYGPELLVTRFASPALTAQQVLAAAALGMLDELALTPYEDQRQARLMDFGHSYSPTLERASAYAVTHGEAVAVDMALSTEIGVALGRLDRTDADTILSVLTVLGLDLSTPWCTETLVQEGFRLTRRQRSGALSLVIPVGIGKADFVDDVPDSVLATAFSRVRLAQAA